MAQNPDDETIVSVIVGDENAAVDVQEEFIDNAPKRKNDTGFAPVCDSRKRQ